MRRCLLLIPILLAVGLGACRGREFRSDGSRTETPKVALVVRSEPPGARVRVGRLIQSWLTPCEISDPAVTRGMVDVELTLEGHEPMKTQVYYDGEAPARVEATLVSRRPPAPPVKPAAPAVVEAVTGTQIKLEPVQGGSRLTIVSPGARVRIAARTLTFDADRGGVYFLPNVPPDDAILEFLDPATGVVLRTLTLAPSPSPFR